MLDFTGDNEYVESISCRSQSSGAGKPESVVVVLFSVRVFSFSFSARKSEISCLNAERESFWTQRQFDSAT
jgi:hypothetical protein